MNLTHLSRQSMKHPIQQIMHFVIQLFGMTFLYFLLKYSNASLIIYMIAMINDPNAIDPIWYLNSHFTPVHTENLALSSEAPPYAKYQMHAAAAMIN